MKDVVSKGPQYYANWVKGIGWLFKLLYPTEVHGRENIIDKPCIICANHSNYCDPFIIAIAFGPNEYIHFMAKQELRELPILGDILIKIGSFCVDRDSSSDISAVRAVMKYIRAGDKVGIFPEGTRVEEDGAAEAKTGAVRMAAKLRVPILPIYITRGKRVFRKNHLVIGEPINVPMGTNEDYHMFAEKLMEKISAMGRDIE